MLTELYSYGPWVPYFQIYYNGGRHIIQDGRRQKIAQLLKRSSSRETIDRFQRNLVEIIDVRCSFRIAKMVVPGSKMGVARGVK